MINYSIIIPHRNSPELLLKAVYSVPERADLEILVVDNSSYDCIGPIQETLLSHGRVFLLYSNNTKGAGRARNVALERATGKWLLFLDADDYFLPRAFEELDTWVETGYDIVYFKSRSIVLSTGKESKRHMFHNRLIEDFMKDGNTAENYLRYRYLGPWGKLIKRSLVEDHNIVFDEVLTHEDVLFSMHTGHWAKTVQCSGNAIYCVTDSPGSLLKSRKRIHRRHAFLMTLKGMCFLRSLGKSQYHPYKNQLMPLFRNSKDLGTWELLRWIGMVLKYRWNMMPEIVEYLKRRSARIFSGLLPKPSDRNY
ncbi:glycosyltransferase family 2 protein [Flagellimonas marinaquae]